MAKEQTRAPVSNDEQPDADTSYEVAAYCNKCRYHYKINVDYSRRKDFQTPCNQSDNENPLHHFRLQESITGKEHRDKFGVNKHDHLIEAHRFLCTGTKCPATLDIRISSPRLGKSLVDMITDRPRLETRGRKEIARDPARYEGVEPAGPFSSLWYLRSYLTDAKAARDSTTLKKIAKRNKKFVIAFGDECNDLFETLGFRMIEEPAELPEVSPKENIFGAKLTHDLTGGYEWVLATSRRDEREHRIH